MAVTRMPRSPSVGGGVRAVLAHQLRRYRRSWRSTVVVSVLSPVLFLLSLGLGLGSIVDSNGGAAGLGVSYLAFLSPALLAAAALQIAAGEAMYPIFGGFKWERSFFAMHGAPLSPGQISLGVLGWIATRVTITSAIYFVVTICFGAVRTPWALLSIPIATLGAVAFAAPVVAYATGKKEMDGGFNAIMRFVVVPMFLFSGTFYDVSQLPRWGEALAWVSPLWHVTELCRAVSLGPLDLAGGVGSISFRLGALHLGYLLLWLVVGVVLARGAFRKRLTE